MQRIAIVGQPGSGKSTLALKLGDLTGLPVFHMDHIHWKPHWVERDRNERVELALAVLAREAWIFEGGLSAINSARVNRAEMLIWLDMPLWLRSWRVFKRTLRYFGRSRPDLQQNCREGLNPEMFRFWKYIWDTRNSGRKKIAGSLHDAPDSLIVRHFKTRHDVRRFLAEVTKEKGRSL